MVDRVEGNDSSASVGGGDGGTDGESSAGGGSGGSDGGDGGGGGGGGGGRCLFRCINFGLELDSRIGIVGPNGAGQNYNHAASLFYTPSHSYPLSLFACFSLKTHHLVV